MLHAITTDMGKYISVLLPSVAKPPLSKVTIWPS
ncbi:hypothetical protein YPPY99_4527, partial [Yersinia pestis PY-99]